MNSIVGICGYMSSGSSAVTDLLKEFGDANVFDNCEFVFACFPDGLEDLDWHLNVKCGKHYGSLAIQRFRRRVTDRWARHLVGKNVAKALCDQFLAEIVQVKWKGYLMHEGGYFSSAVRRYVRGIVWRLSSHLKLSRLPKLYFKIMCREEELATRPSNFDTAAKEYVDSLLDAMGCDRSKLTVLDQPFNGNNPVTCFKYFGNPKAVVVDRDPRDCYLFYKLYLRSKGIGLQMAVDTVDEFIAWYKAVRNEPDGLRERGDILFMNFEELIYDYENTVRKVADFCGVEQHIRKGEFFKPRWSRNNSQLFKNYESHDEDIAKIEKQLHEYLFPFERYPDIEAEGEMFYGSQTRRR